MKRMLKSYVMSALLLAVFSACGNRPEPLRGDTQLIAPPSGAGAPAVWVATSDFRGSGWLTRIDLATGGIQRNVREVGTDVALASDGASGFFLLTRGTGESITAMRGAEAVPSGSFPLPNNSNPQHAARDGQGRIWVASMESNIVDVLSADLRLRAGAVDVGALRDDADGLAEPYYVVKLAGGLMGVVAARIQRPAWTPSPRAGAALIEEATLKAKETELLRVTNATQAFASGGGMIVIGSGALLPSSPLPGGIELLGAGTLASVEHRALTGRILHADMGPTGELAYIDWRPSERRSCIRYGLRELLCDGHAAGAGDGYIFSRVLVAGNTIFAAYAKDGNSELWSIPLSGGEVQRLRMDQPVQSLILGP